MNAIEERLAASDPARRNEPLLSDEAAAEMLAAILRDDPAPRRGRAPRRHRRRKSAVGGIAVSLAVAGTAIAGGGMPGFVRDALKRMDQGGMSVDLENARRLASVKDRSDVLELYGTTAADGGRCWSLVRRGPSGDYTDEGGTECARGDGERRSARLSSEHLMDITGEGVEGKGTRLYGELPADAASVELHIPGEPDRAIPIDNGYIITHTGPAGWTKGYDLIVRDSRGAVIGRQSEPAGLKGCAFEDADGVPGVKDC
jgi:hypothetical protein